MKMSKPLQDKSLTIVIVEKAGSLKSLTIKDFTEDDLYKKCGFKKADGFKKQTDYKIKLNEPNKKMEYVVSVFAKEEGKANGENKYDFPPPIDKKLFFGSCALVSYLKQPDNSWSKTDLTLPLWKKMYEKLFGGFHDLTMTILEDEEEEDELLHIPAEKKTKQGYLKDGFVIDSDSQDEEDDSGSYDTEDEDEYEEDKNDLLAEEEDDKMEIEDIGSELSEEEYDYEDEEEEEEDDDDEDVVIKKKDNK